MAGFRGILPLRPFGVRRLLGMARRASSESLSPFVILNTPSNYEVYRMLISLLINLLILGLILGLIYWVITLIPLPPPFPLVIRVVLAVILIIVLLQYVFPMLLVGTNYHGLLVR